MAELGFTIKKNLASTIRDYLKSKGRNVSEEDIDTILQRLVDLNSARTKKESIFTGGHKYFGGSEKDFVVQKDRKVNLSVEEYNKIFDGYLEKEGSSQLSDETLKDIKNQAFKTSLSKMSEKQLIQITDIANITSDIEQLGMIALEYRVRGNNYGAESVEKAIIEIEKQYKQENENTSEIVQGAKNIQNSEKTEQPTTKSEQKAGKEVKINPSEEEIRDNIDNLKQGENYTFLQVKDQDSWGFGKNQKPITWTRNEDNTLTCVEPVFQIDGYFGSTEEIYSADRTQLLSRKKWVQKAYTQPLNF